MFVQIDVDASWLADTIREGARRALEQTVNPMTLLSAVCTTPLTLDGVTREVDHVEVREVRVERRDFEDGEDFANWGLATPSFLVRRTQLVLGIGIALVADSILRANDSKPSPANPFPILYLRFDLTVANRISDGLPCLRAAFAEFDPGTRKALGDALTRVRALLAPALARLSQCIKLPVDRLGRFLGDPKLGARATAWSGGGVSTDGGGTVVAIRIEYSLGPIVPTAVLISEWKAFHEGLLHSYYTYYTASAVPPLERNGVRLILDGGHLARITRAQVIKGLAADPRFKAREVEVSVVAGSEATIQTRIVGSVLVEVAGLVTHCDIDVDPVDTTTRIVVTGPRNLTEYTEGTFDLDDGDVFFCAAGTGVIVATVSGRLFAPLGAQAIAIAAAIGFVIGFVGTYEYVEGFDPDLPLPELPDEERPPAKPGEPAKTVFAWDRECVTSKAAGKDFSFQCAWKLIEKKVALSKGEKMPAGGPSLTVNLTRAYSWSNAFVFEAKQPSVAVGLPPRLNVAVDLAPEWRVPVPELCSFGPKNPAWLQLLARWVLRNGASGTVLSICGQPTVIDDPLGQYSRGEVSIVFSPAETPNRKIRREVRIIHHYDNLLVTRKPFALPTPRRGRLRTHGGDPLAKSATATDAPLRSDGHPSVQRQRAAGALHEQTICCPLDAAARHSPLSGRAHGSPSLASRQTGRVAVHARAVAPHITCPPWQVQMASLHRSSSGRPRFRGLAYRQSTLKSHALSKSRSGAGGQSWRTSASCEGLHAAKARHTAKTLRIATS